MEKLLNGESNVGKFKFCGAWLIRKQTNFRVGLCCVVSNMNVVEGENPSALPADNHPS